MSGSAAPPSTSSSALVRAMALSAEVRARWEPHDDHTIEIDTHIQPVDVGGTKTDRPVCEAVRIERNPNRPPLDGLELRRLNLKRKIEQACLGAAMREAPPGSGGWEPAGREDDLRAVLDDVRRSQRRRITKEFLQQVATVYLEEDGDMDAVTRKMYISKAQTYRYVREACKQGFLPEVDE